MGKSCLFNDYLKVDESPISWDKTSIEAGWVTPIDDIKSAIEISNYHNNTFNDTIDCTLDDLKADIGYLSGKTKKKKRKISIIVRL